MRLHAALATPAYAKKNPPLMEDFEALRKNGLASSEHAEVIYMSDNFVRVKVEMEAPGRSLDAIVQLAPARDYFLVESVQIKNREW